MREQLLQAGPNKVFNLIRDPNYGVLQAACLTADIPASKQGYAPYCLLQVFDPASEAAAWYVNTGTLASCTFTAWDLNLTEAGLLSGLLATAAEINRAAQLSTTVVAAGAAALSLTVAAHDKKIVLADQAAGVTFTLPSAVAAVVGARFEIRISVSLTSGSLILQVANNADYMIGQCDLLSDDAAGGPVKAFETANSGTVATESDTITFNRSTTGTAKKGGWITVECVAANVWAVTGRTGGTGTEATPFSAAV